MVWKVIELQNFHKCNVWFSLKSENKSLCLNVSALKLLVRKGMKKLWVNDNNSVCTTLLNFESHKKINLMCQQKYTTMTVRWKKKCTFSKMAKPKKEMQNGRERAFLF